MHVHLLFTCSKLCYNSQITVQMITVPNNLTTAKFDLLLEESLAIGTSFVGSGNCLFLQTTELKWSCSNARKGLAFEFEKGLYFVENLDFAGYFGAKLNYWAHFQLRKDYFACRKVLAHFDYAKSLNHFCDSFVSLCCSLHDFALSSQTFTSGQPSF